MKIQNVLNCQYQKWYPIFKGVTFKAKTFKLSQDFIDFLREDGLEVHEDYAKVHAGSILVFLYITKAELGSDSSFSEDTIKNV